MADDKLQQLPVDLIHRGRYQPRQDFPPESLQELADSIAAQGVVQPIVVRQVGSRYELIAGERRWRATQLAGLSEIPAVVREVTDEQAAATSLIENIQREDLNPVEQATAFQRLKDEFRYTQDDLAAAVGWSRSAVANALRLLKMNPMVQDWVREGNLERGHAKVLAGLSHADQLALGQKAIAGQMTVSQLAKLVKQRRAAPAPEPTRRPDPVLQSVIDTLTAFFGQPVKLEQAGEQWRMRVTAHTLEELMGVLERSPGQLDAELKQRGKRWHLLLTADNLDAMNKVLDSFGVTFD